MLIELPKGYRCAGRCGVDEFCSDVMFRAGYCHKPKDREIGLILEFGENDERVKRSQAWTRTTVHRSITDPPDYAG